MATAKTESFSPLQVEMARIAKALSHPARIAILEILHRRQACVCGSIVDELPLSQATVSQHLKELKEAGLIQGTIDGPRVCYCIDPDGMKAAASMLGLFMNEKSGPGPDRCAC